MEICVQPHTPLGDHHPYVFPCRLFTHSLQYAFPVLVWKDRGRFYWQPPDFTIVLTRWTFWSVILLWGGQFYLRRGEYSIWGFSCDDGVCSCFRCPFSKLYNEHHFDRGGETQIYRRRASFPRFGFHSQLKQYWWSDRSPGGAMFGWLYISQLRNGSDWAVPVNKFLEQLTIFFKNPV